MFHSDGYDHPGEDHQKQEDTYTEETLMDHQQDHLWDTHTTEEVRPGGGHPDVMCRWHAQLDVSWVWAAANLTEVMVLCSDPKPLLAESFGELMGFRDKVGVFCCDSTGGYPGRTR
jgi:hypothetical protein